jgi:hypothetical protein
LNQFAPNILLLSIVLALFTPANAFSAGAEGEVRLFVVEKSKNPENILVVYCKVTKRCALQSIADAGQDHYFDFYWLMNRTTYKRTHSLIKKLARKRFIVQNVSENATGFTVLLADLKELVHDLPSDLIRIDFHQSPDGRCEARALLELGPSGDNHTMQIDLIYSKARTFIGLPIGIQYVELHGTDTQSQKKISVRFNRNKQIEFDFQTIPSDDHPR